MSERHFTGRAFLATAVSLSAMVDEASQRSAISRAYYACFLTARAMLLRRGIPIRQDGRAHVAVRVSLERTQPHSRVAWELKRLHDMRKKADYDIPFPEPDLLAEMAVAISLATGILAEIDAIADSLTPPT